MESIIYKPGKRMQQRIFNLNKAGDREKKEKHSQQKIQNKETKISPNIYIHNKYEWVRLT